jgi:hypothetical protein
MRAELLGRAGRCGKVEGDDAGAFARKAARDRSSESARGTGESD